MLRTTLWLGVLIACGGDEGGDKVGSGTEDTSTTTFDKEPTDEPIEYDGFTDLSWLLHSTVHSFARVTWNQAAPMPVHVEFSVDEGEWLSTPTIDGVAGANEQLVVGIPYGMSAAWRVVGPDGYVEAEDPIEVARIPDGLPQPRLEVAEPGGWLADGNYLLTSVSETGGGWSTNGPFWTVILDRRGRAVWSSRTRVGTWTLYAQVSVTGDHIIYDEFSWFGGTDSTIAQRSYLDEPIEEVPMPGFHHAFIEHPDGTLAWASYAHGGGEALVEKAPGQEDETIIWTCGDDWPESGGRCSSNCIYYDVERDTYLYSFYSNETVVEVDRATGETLWWAGGVGGGYEFYPGYTQFYWQHGVTWTDAGTLLVSTHDSRFASTNLAREYEVDHDLEALIEVWSYNADALADTNGDTWRLSNGNTLHTLGSASEVKEVAPDGRSVWHIDYGGDQLLGRSEWIEDLYDLVSP